MSLPIRSAIAFLLTTMSASLPAAEHDPIRIGVLSHRGDAATERTWQPTADYLNAALPGIDFRVVPLHFAAVDRAVAGKTVDFVLVNPGIYVNLEVRHRVSRIATMRNRAVKAGAVDFIEKPFNDQTLLDAVHRAFEQDATRRGQASRLADIQERLTPREREIMELVVVGKRNKVIAADLGISQSTVEAHRAKVMEKLEAKTLSDLMRMVLLTKLES